MRQQTEDGYAISVRELVVRFGRVVALDGVDLQVPKGAVYGIVGTNGAGKSTLLDVLSGLVRPSSGGVRVLGMDPISDAPRIRRRVGVVPQEVSLEERLTGRENLEYFGRLLDVPEEQLVPRVDELISFMGLEERQNDRVETYSVGMKRKIHFACSMVHSPELILADEPMVGFDPRTRREVAEMILELNRTRGVTVVLTTHDLTDARDICSEVSVLHRGSVVARGTWFELSSRIPAKLLVKGMVTGRRADLVSAAKPYGVSEAVGGFEIQVPSVSEAFALVKRIEGLGITPGSIAFEIPPEEVFETLTRDEAGDGS